MPSFDKDQVVYNFEDQNQESEDSSPVLMKNLF